MASLRFPLVTESHACTKEKKIVLHNPTITSTQSYIHGALLTYIPPDLFSGIVFVFSC